MTNYPEKVHVYVKSNRIISIYKYGTDTDRQVPLTNSRHTYKLQIYSHVQGVSLSHNEMVIYRQVLR